VRCKGFAGLAPDFTKTVGIGVRTRTTIASAWGVIAIQFAGIRVILFEDLKIPSAFSHTIGTDVFVFDAILNLIATDFSEFASLEILAAIANFAVYEASTLDVAFFVADIAILTNLFCQIRTIGFATTDEANGKNDDVEKLDHDSVRLVVVVFVGVAFVAFVVVVASGVISPSAGVPEEVASIVAVLFHHIESSVTLSQLICRHVLWIVRCLEVCAIQLSRASVFEIFSAVANFAIFKAGTI